MRPGGTAARAGRARLPGTLQKDQIVQREGYLLNLVRYIAINPVRAGLVKHTELSALERVPCLAGLASIPASFPPRPNSRGFRETSRRREAAHGTSSTSVQPAVMTDDEYRSVPFPPADASVTVSSS